MILHPEYAAKTALSAAVSSVTPIGHYEKASRRTKVRLTIALCSICTHAHKLAGRVTLVLRLSAAEELASAVEKRVRLAWGTKQALLVGVRSRVPGVDVALCPLRDGSGATSHDSPSGSDIVNRRRHVVQLDVVEEQRPGQLRSQCAAGANKDLERKRC
jgi:hypothetical protein